MQQKDVVIGGIYETYIGQNLCRVVVVAKREGSSGRPGMFTRIPKSRDTFIVRREGETTNLPKARTAAALREIR